MKTIKNRIVCAAIALAAGFAALATPTVQADVIDDLGGDVTLRLRASDLTLTNGDPVSAWGALTQGTAGNQPTFVASDAQFNGASVVDFSGDNSATTGDRLSAAGVNYAARTVIAVANAESGGGLRGLLSRGDDRLNLRLDSSTQYRSPGNGQDGNDFPGVASGGGLAIDAAVTSGAATGSYTVNTPHIMTALAGSTQNYSNLTVGNGTSAGSGPFSSRHWDGQIAEIVMIDRELTPNETFSVLNFLGETYGVSVARGTIQGTGNGALIGGDSTDPENDGAPDANTNYNVVQFIANNEPGFGGGENAFNVFDNRTGGGNDKWCCDGIVSGGSFVGAQFAVGGQLDSFTATSSNDSPDRDAIHWAIQGSNDGTSWTDVFVQDAQSTLWTARSQTILFEAGVDYDVTANYSWYRYIAYETGSATQHALGELEFFLIPTPAALPAGLMLMTLAAVRRRSTRQR